jgi:GTP1/Obg family GTP-binding protein
VVDTPGVLGRKSRSNPAEAEAETTVDRAATVVLFALDPSGTAGYTAEEQESLLERWKEEYPTLPILAVETKADVFRRPNDRPKVSAVTGEGVDEVLREIRELVKPKGEMPPLEESMIDEAETDHFDVGESSQERSPAARGPRRRGAHK